MTLTDKQIKRFLEIFGANYVTVRYAEMFKDGKKPYACLKGCRSTKKEKTK